ncbi:UDP-N-acetylglucosamine transferase subunit [Orbilia oligospora]|nr:UDP-N-acetylglucosamine transferase subunit [Orbilia oligospora]KAF3187762.1 UDP-N-acetylglucosamine transferase subunit [Orbilia oligospora]KAF3248395.1 UDP-N-acetylglucosamine transferase subunit [Orbilia oligospora]KAF3256899.1 UDP-N-acetylglucosamine transferase subunit [Orbilia oligospora]KAF3294051.1 UDP-N-acetylglucosamine transferase subunit [Orbilia oligospora]
MLFIVALFFSLLLIFIFISLRIYFILPSRPSTTPQTSILQSSRIVELTPPEKSHVLMILGSGGHTAEMFSLLSSISPDIITHRTYVFSSGDIHSARSAQAFETSLAGSYTKKANEKIGYRLLEIPRARRVRQSWVTTPWSCLMCLIGCMNVLRGGDLEAMSVQMKSCWEGRRFPDVVVCNGPATAVMMVLACYIYKFFGRCSTRIIYVESFARVTTMSLSGKLLLPLADRFLVQWPQLAERYPVAEHFGFLVS